MKINIKYTVNYCWMPLGQRRDGAAGVRDEECLQPPGRRLQVGYHLNILYSCPWFLLAQAFLFQSIVLLSLLSALVIFLSFILSSYFFLSLLFFGFFLSASILLSFLTIVLYMELGNSLTCRSFLAGLSVWVGPVGHSFAYVAHFVFLGDIWIRTQRAAVASKCATNLATHLQCVVYRKLEESLTGRVIAASGEAVRKLQQ